VEIENRLSHLILII